MQHIEIMIEFQSVNIKRIYLQEAYLSEKTHLVPWLL